MNELPLDQITHGLSFSKHPVVIAGDSHLGTMSNWVTADPAALAPMGGIQGLFSLNGLWPRQADYWSTLNLILKSIDGMSAALMYRGNDHGYFMLRPDIPFDFFSTEFPHLPVDETVTLVTEELVEAYFRTHCEPVRGIVADIVAAGRRAIVLATPPPKRDETFLRNAIAAERYFQEVIQFKGETIESVQFTEPFLRLKQWGAMCGAMRQLSLEGGGEFLELPSSVKDEDGFLHPRFYDTDCTHANAAFGVEIIQHLSRFMQDQAT